jgi:hypothetical protein
MAKNVIEIKPAHYLDGSLQTTCCGKNYRGLNCGNNPLWFIHQPHHCDICLKDFSRLRPNYYAIYYKQGRGNDKH